MTKIFSSFVNLSGKVTWTDDANLNVVEFNGCNLQDFNLTESKVDINFEKCDLTRSYFYKTSLKGVDFSTCNINDIIIPSELLKGIKVNALQAAELAKLLGLIIVDDY